MTRNEFMIRTQFAISEKEYAAVEVVYMASDLDKDEFCKMWCKMNKSRVQAAREMKRQQMKREGWLETMRKLNKRWDEVSMLNELPITCLFVKGQEVVAMDALGIKDEYYMHETMANIRKYFNENNLDIRTF